jgi:hypothetical protein
MLIIVVSFHREELSKGAVRWRTGLDDVQEHRLEARRMTASDPPVHHELVQQATPNLFRFCSGIPISAAVSSSRGLGPATLSPF